MSDPIRWRNDPSAPGSVRDLLSQARATPPMPPDVQASLAQELAKLGPPAPATPSLLASKEALKVVAGLALAGVATWGGVKLLKSAPIQRAPIVVEASPAPAPIVEPLKAEEVPGRKPVPDATPAPAREPVKGDRLKEETALIEKARQLLTSDASQAFRLLKQHRRQFPQGQLSAEREALAIDALGQLGRTEEQQRRATAFLKDYATSPYVGHVRRIVDGR